MIHREAILKHGEFPLWSPYLYGGDPFFAKPEVAVLSLSGIGLSAFSGWVVAMYNLLFHSGILALGLWAMVLSVGGSAVSALVCVFGFLLSNFHVEAIQAGHESALVGLAWMSWVLVFFMRAIHRESLDASHQHPYFYGALAGMAVSLQILEGSPGMCLYTMVALLVFGLAAPGKSWPAFLKAFLALGLSSGLLSSVKWIPMMNLMALGNRRMGLTLEDATMDLSEFTGVGISLSFCLLALAGTAILFFRRKRALFPWVAMGLAGLFLSRGGWFYEVFWRYFPFFRFQRVPERAFILTLIAMVPLAAAAIDFFRSKVSRGAFYRLAPVFLALFFAEFLLEAPSYPPTRDIRLEVRGNPVLNYLSSPEKPFRMHTLETPDRHWGIQHVTVPLGLETFLGFDNTWHADFMGLWGRGDILSYVSASFRHPGRLLGLMNVRYVTSQKPLAHRSFRLVAKFPEGPPGLCQPDFSDGPYLYENKEVMPRAWLVPHGILLLGPKTASDRLLYRMLIDDRFDPRKIVLIQSEQAAQPGAFPPCEASLTFDIMGKAELRIMTPRGPTLLRGNAERLAQILLEQARSWPGRKMEAPSFAASHLRSRISGQTSGGKFLVVSSKHALWPGWHAGFASGEKARLWKANGVLTAVWIPEGKTFGLSLYYLPGLFVLGLSLTLLAFALSFIWISKWLPGSLIFSRRRDIN